MACCQQVVGHLNVNFRKYYVYFPSSLLPAGIAGIVSLHIKHTLSPYQTDRDNPIGDCCFLLQVASAGLVYENMTRWHVENLLGVIMFFCATWIQNETSELTCWCCGIEKYLTCLEMWCGPQGKSTCWQIVWIILWIIFVFLYFRVFVYLCFCISAFV